MRVFVAGGTGVLGRRTLPRLVAAGHEVVAVARSATGRAVVEDAGATPVQVDLFDDVAVGRALVGVEAVVNLATRIPVGASMAWPGSWRENDRLRREASRVLVDAALRAGAGRFVQESVALLYADGGERWLDEQAPVLPGRATRSALAAEANALDFGEHGGAGVALRFGVFVDDTAAHTEEAVRLLRRGIAPVFGGPEAYQSSIFVEDAAAAVVAALEVPTGVYNVVDDEPLRAREYAEAAAAAFGLPSLELPPAAAGRLPMVRVLARSRRVTNRRFRERSGWTPVWPSARESWAEVARRLGAVART